MNANSSIREFARKMGAALVLGTIAANGHGAATALGTEPFTLSGSIKALPNVMFVLDDSGSMRMDYLPDWAGPNLAADNTTVLTPGYRFFNGAFNGVAYNPGTYYRPPVMYGTGGALDTTSYPSQTGQSSSTGGDGSATAGSPNWRAVKVDGYGIQSAATANLEGNAFSYTTVPGEYCTSQNLRLCTASASATGSFTVPAPLRWCTTAARSLGTTANADTYCQASNIANTARSATITIAGLTAVSSITVDGNQILSATTTTAGGSPGIAADVAAKINACTVAATGSCAVAGYSATSASNVVTVTAAGTTTATPVVTGGTATATAFAPANGVTPYYHPRMAPPRTASVKVNSTTTITGITVDGAQILSASASGGTVAAVATAIAANINACTFGTAGACTVVGFSALTTGAIVTITAPNGTTSTPVIAPNTSTTVAAFLASPRTATITVGGTTSVTGITVDGYQILSAATGAGATATAVATAMAANINACTAAAVGSCAVSGYRATSLGPVVTLTAPGATAATPTISGGSTTPSAFVASSIPGSSLFTVITSTINSYPYPGTAAKSSNRTDCAGTTCTYAEEMTNYANWYAYYRTRMQMMKTAASVAFSSVDDQFRVGYYSINNGSGADFLNPSAFDGTQKNLWYTKFLGATPFGATPLRAGLANTGRLYAGMLAGSTLNGVTANDPMQYSCQQNFTILSTDGYWNDASNPKQIDGTTDIGEQDYNLDRPYYDGGTQTRSVSQTLSNEEQWALNTTLYEQRTQQQQTTSRRLTQNVITTDTYPWTTQATTLQTRTTPLNQTAYSVRQRTYDLKSDTYPLNQSTYYITSTPRILQSYINNLTETTTPLQDKQFNITSVTTPLQDKQFNITSVTTPLQDKQFNITSVTTPLQDKQFNITSVTTPLQDKQFNITSVTTVLQQKTYSLQSTTQHLQAMSDISTDGGDTYHTTGWVDVNSCTVTTPGVVVSYTKNTVCRYNPTTTVTGGLSSCTVATASPGPTNYTVPVATSCVYETTPVVADVTTCNAVAQSGTFANRQVTCTYTGTVTTLTNETACTAVAQSASNPYTGPARTCTHNASPVSTTDTATCTAVTPANAATPKHTCTYTGTATTLTNETACTAVAASAGPTNYTGPMRTCTHNASPVSTTDTTTCTAVTPANAATPKHTCTYTGTPTTLTKASCTTVPQSTANTYTGPAVSCAYQAAVLTGTGLATCTAGSASAGPTFAAYTSCGYINGTPLTGQSSCTYLADSPGPTNYTGPKNACAYEATATVSPNVPNCTVVAQSGTYAAPQVACAYAATATTGTGLLNCTNAAASPGPTNYSGPRVDCYYDTATLTDTNLPLGSSCTVHDSGGSPYTGGARVRCTYNSGSTTNNVGACSAVAKSTSTANGTVYPTAYDCAYGSTTAWANATAACVPQAQSSAPNYVGPARDCQYTTPSVNTFTGTCTPAAQNNTNLTAINCVAGSFPVVFSNVTTTVDSCDTTPTSSGSPVVRSTATTCTYQAPVTVDTATCTPHAADTTTPYLTARSCPVTDTNWNPVTVVPITTSCTPAGTPPATFDGTGKIVQCRSTDTTPYNLDYPSGPVPVSSCTVGTTDNAATGVRTVCVKPVTALPSYSNTSPIPVDPTTCIATASAVAPRYIWTRCNTVPSTSTVMGCASQAPSSPLWQTVSCADDGTGTRNTLADVAAYYYYTDLRRYALNNCTGAVNPVTGVAGVLCSQTDDLNTPPKMNNVPTTASDPASWQHMTTFTLGLGASGYMKYTADGTGDYATVYGAAPHAPLNSIAADPANGVCSWQPAGTPCNWPIPVSDQQTTIDDLWHAGINGHGAYFSATDPSSLATSISAALTGVAAAGGASASPTISNPSLTPGDSYIFSSTYTTLDWTGELVRRQLDPITGAVSANNDWSVQGKLDAKTYTSRAIWTFDASVPTTKLKAFNSTNFGTSSNFLAPNISTAPTGLTQYICSSADTCLSPTNQDTSHAAGANLVKYLMGDRSNEGGEKDNTKYYRQRQHVLGDMVNAQIVYVHLPLYNYADPGYTAFIASQVARAPIAYAGANDGMLHAFNAKGTAATESLMDAAAAATSAAAADPSSAALATAAATAVAAANTAVAADTVIGQEVWAYIPSMVLPNLYKLADKKYKDQHRYYVDGTPVFGDICTANCSLASATWKTILVGGLGHGGRGYYALDVTVPASPKALWEFTDANLGYSYGNPQIAKLADGTWVVLVSSGYNNIPNADGAGGDGVGRLFVIDAATGTLIRSISTGVGDTTTPSGLAKITAQVISPDSDNTIEAVYGGDLLGNLWRFDVNNNIGAAGFDAQLLATLRDGSGNPQPISTIPQVSAIPTTGEKLVYIGTGTYLAASDSTNVNQQSLYAIKDPRSTGTVPGTALFDNPGGAPRPAATTAANSTSTLGFVRQIQTEETCPAGTLASICTAGQLVRTSTTWPVDFSTQNGWFIDLITSGERANTDPALALGELVVNTNAPSVEACEVGGTSYTYFLNYLTGGPIGESPSATSLIKKVVGKRLANQLASSPTLAITKEGKLISITGLSGGGINIVQPPLPPGASVARRTSWRELIRE